MKKATSPFRFLSCGMLPALVFLVVFVSTRIVAQTELWGMTSAGAEGYGSIFKLNTDGSGFANFVFENLGGNPYADLLESGGKFYGMTHVGGSFGYGVIFEYDPAIGGTGIYTIRHNFDEMNGVLPQGSLIASDGKFYGMTSGGGSYGLGVIFEYDPAISGTGAYTVKYHFDPANGGNPRGSLIVSSGKFYGMTPYGGNNGAGVLFEYDPSAAGNEIYKVRHHFDNTNGKYPFGSLLESDGKLYGMTVQGGNSNEGVLFEYDPVTVNTGIYTVKHHFKYATGSNPYGSLIFSGGKFYGMTYNGGILGNAGVLFEYDPSIGGTGAYTVKYHFDHFNDGENPRGSLVAFGGKFYGMTTSGGNSTSGVLFEYDPTIGGTGAYTVKHDFDAFNFRGQHPYGSLIVSGGKFYGMTTHGGSTDYGVLFEYDPAGGGAETFSVKHHFGSSKGREPFGNLIESGGKFYGMTSHGGNLSDGGVLFEYDPTANSGSETFSIKHHFDPATGSLPQGSLIASGGKFYGMTSRGGSDNGGVLFEYDPAGSVDGTYTVLYDFDEPTGFGPSGNLETSGGKFYGLATYGGWNGYGVLFEYDPAGSGGGNYTVKFDFGYLDGVYPHGSLIESGGKFYGMTYVGGNNDGGTLFEFDPAGSGGGTFTVKHHFEPNNGGNPLGSLIASGSKLYGLTSYGGSNYVGVLFEYDPSGSGGGTYTVKHHFIEANGGKPLGSLVASSGKFYGTTSSGGSNNLGVIFEYDPAGAGDYTVLRHLELADGDNPSGDLIAVTLVNTTTPAESPAIEIQLSPNPSGDLMAIEIFSEKALSGNLSIFGSDGRQITELAKDRIFYGQERIVWQAVDLPSGVYFLRLQTDAGEYTVKFIRQ